MKDETSSSERVARGPGNGTLCAMRSLALMLVGTLLAVGCDAPEASHDDSPSARDDDDASEKPKKKKRRANAKQTAMPLGKIRIDPPDEDGDGYRVDHDTVIQVLALIAADAMPVAETGDGYRIEDAPEGSVIELAGLKKGDVVTAVNGVPVLDAEVLRKAHELFAIAQGIALTVRRKDETLALNYRVYSTRPRRAPPTRSSSDPLPRPSRDFSDAVKNGVREVSENRFEVSRKALDEILESPAPLMRSSRIIPAVEDGKSVGLKLYGIREESLASLFGFKNGDRLELVNGLAITTPDSALDAYQSLRKHPKTTVSLTRRGKPLRFEYTLVDP